MAKPKAYREIAIKQHQEGKSERYGPILNEHQMKTRVYITRWWR